MDSFPASCGIRNQMLGNLFFDYFVPYAVKLKKARKQLQCRWELV